MAPITIKVWVTDIYNKTIKNARMLHFAIKVRIKTFSELIASAFNH